MASVAPPGSASACGAPSLPAGLWRRHGGGGGGGGRRKNGGRKTAMESVPLPICKNLATAVHYFIYHAALRWRHPLIIQSWHRPRYLEDCTAHV